MDAVLIKELLPLQHRILAGFEHRIEAAQDGEGQDDIAVFAAHVDVAQPVVGDVPDEVGDPLELRLVNGCFVLFAPVDAVQSFSSGWFNSDAPIQ